LASNFIRLAWFWQTNLIGYCSRNVMAGLDPAIHALLSQDMGWKTPPPVSQNTKVFLLLFLQKKKALDPTSIPQIQLIMRRRRTRQRTGAGADQRPGPRPKPRRSADDCTAAGTDRAAGECPLTRRIAATGNSQQGGR
jgi:hypothetical protein